MDEALPTGAYESLHTHALDRALRTVTDAAPQWGAVETINTPDVLARHVANAVRRVLGEVPHDDRLQWINDLLAQVADDADAVVALEQLLALAIPTAPGVFRLRPATPLSDVALLTNTRGEPSLGAELRAELASADRVDLLCAFIQWHGIRILADEFEALSHRRIPLRVITTTYRGATQRRALDELVRRFGAEVRIRYDTQSTRLHAKAWLFGRNSGFDTGYVGSSNLSKSAMLDGLEWNVRISAVATPVLVRKFRATFDTYWNNPDFLTYDPDRDAELLDRALAAEGGPGGNTIVLSGLEVRPFPHQERILEALDAERTVHDRHRNLVVAATGTGKTVIAALDYRRLRQQSRYDTLLFVAHRKEILDQALRTYREVLAEGTFGEAMVGGQRPQEWRHVFASVQSLSTVEALPHFDVVVIDEFHHAEAVTYRRLLSKLQPGELLGLTATPDRADGVDVRSFFDGRTAYELPLGEALDQDLLCPFHYFGIADNTDLTAIEWSRGNYDVSGLSGLYTGNDARAAIVLKALHRQVTDTNRMRALGFCVSVAHAEYMARVFTEAGIPSRALSGQTPLAERSQAAAALRNRDIRCLFTVDLFNEGVDLPNVDTLLLLRPTSSATVFLQQLGRGLRCSSDKAVLTVLDFIGQHRREYRFDLRYRALTGTSRSQLRQEIELGFPFLPSGSQLVLDRVTREIVLDNVRSSLSRSRRELVADIKSHGDLPLATFLAESGRDVADIYGRPRQSWTDLRREADLPTPSGGPHEAALLSRIRSLSHVDDPERSACYARLVDPDGPSYDSLTPHEQIIARMLFFTLWPNRGDFSSYDEGLAQQRTHPAVRAEICELLALTTDLARHVPRPLDIPGVALLSHASYRREEILAGIGWAHWERKPHGRAAGIAWASETGVDALLVTLHKEERNFSPTTRYRDYPIAADLFHWESQNSTSRSSTTGRRYLTGGSRVLLLVRAALTNDLGSAPYLCLGEATLVEHHGERPIGITWHLHRPMPPEVLQQGSIASG